MKRILLLIVGIVGAFSAHAQFPGMGGTQKATVTGRISAIILDSLTQKPLDYATVSLIKVSDNKSVNGGLTDEKGKVSLQNVAPNEYKMGVAFMGYKTKFIMVKTTPERPDNNIGTIYLSVTGKALEEVQISGQKALVENKVDKLVYNAENDATNSGGNASDVLRKVPMLSVDLDGNVQLRGSSQIRVLINGKPSGTMANNVADALKMIPGDEIKSVEVITSPSAKYDAEGSGGIINIITKKKSAQGISGSVNLSAGTRLNNAGASLNVKKGRLGFTSSVGGNYFETPNTMVDIRNESFIDNSVVTQAGKTRTQRYGYYGSFGVDYDINAYNNLSSNIKLNSFNFGINGVLNGLISMPTSSNSYVRNTNNKMGMDGLDWTADYRKTSKKEGEEFSVSTQVTLGRNINDFNSEIINSGSPNVSIIGNNTGKNNEYTLQTDYTYPITKVIKLESGLKGIFRDIVSKYQITGNAFNYHQNVGAAYSVLGFSLGKYSLKTGLRAEFTGINIKTTGITNGDKNYFNLFPSAIISRTLKGNHTLKLSYNRRMQRPSLYYLNPYTNNSDPQNQQEGNPYLSPELTNQVEFGYSTFIKGSVINASVFYRNTDKIIESVYNPSTKVTSFFNVGTNDSWGANLFGSYNPMPKWTLMGNVAVNSYQVKNATTGVNTGNYLNYNAFARSSTVFNGGFTTEIIGIFNSPRRTFQGKNPAFNLLILGVKKDLWKKKGTVGLNVANPFSANKDFTTELRSDNFAQYSNASVPFRSFGVNFSYTFGKLKFTEKKKIKNDDLKQGEQQGGGMGVGG